MLHQLTRLAVLSTYSILSLATASAFASTHGPLTTAVSCAGPAMPVPTIPPPPTPKSRLMEVAGPAMPVPPIPPPPPTPKQTTREVAV